jgi:ribosomal protein L9
MADGIQPTQLIARAHRWRKQAEHETKQKKVSQLLQLAEALEQEANAISRYRREEALSAYGAIRDKPLR